MKMSGLFWLCVVAALGSGLPACSGSQGKGTDTAADVKLAPAPDLRIVVHVEAESGQAQGYTASVEKQLKSMMSSAGYKLVEGDKADVEAKVGVSATEESSMFAMQVNGQTRKSHKVLLSASFVGAGGAVVDTATSEFSSSDGTVDAGAVRKLLVQVSNSGKLVTYASEYKDKAAKAEAEKVAKAAADEEGLWKAANVDGCKSATKKSACDGVQAYIQKYPSGKFTAEGRQALASADESIAKSADEEAWKAAGVDTCKKPTKSYDCRDVDAYVKKFPGGAHATEARDLLKSTEKAREAMVAKEKSAAKKASFAQCEKSCKRFYERAVPGAFEILVRRCVEVECK